jgi:hypothetical protein
VLCGIGNLPRGDKERTFVPLIDKWLLFVLLNFAETLKDVVAHGMRGNAEIEEVICLMDRIAAVECAIGLAFKFPVQGLGRIQGRCECHCRTRSLMAIGRYSAQNPRARHEAASVCKAAAKNKRAHVRDSARVLCGAQHGKLAT